MTCAELLANVAEAQKTLADTLNDAADRLKQAIVSTDDPAVLIDANRAINRTLIEVACQEQALYDELERILEFCGSCKPKPEDPCTATQNA